MASFSLDDARILITVARLAPLQNMEAAEKLAGSLARFTEHCSKWFGDPNTPPAPSEGVDEVVPA